MKLHHSRIASGKWQVAMQRQAFDCFVIFGVFKNPIHFYHYRRFSVDLILKERIVHISLIVLYERRWHLNTYDIS